MQRMDSTSSDELLWVNVKKPTDIKNAGVMKQIRSHTQREVRRKERISKPKCISTKAANKRTSKVTDRSPVLSVEKVPLVVVEEEKREEKTLTESTKQRIIIQNYLKDFAAEAFRCPSPPLAIAASSRDSVRLNQKIYRYLSVWQGDRALQLCGGSVHGRWEYWMPTVITNSTMMHAQAFCAATHFEFWGNQSTSAETWALKDLAVTRVNENLANPNFSQNDSNVASVLCLAFASHVENSGEATCMAHMRGLQQIIDMRGGWNQVLSNELLSDLLAMADFLAAIIFKTPLLYTPIDTRELEFPVHNILNCPLISSNFFFNRPEQGEDLSSEAFRTLNNMQKLTEWFEELFTSSGLPLFGTARLEASFATLEPAYAPSPLTRSSSSSSSPSAPGPATPTSGASPGSQSAVSSVGDRNADHNKEYLNEAIGLAGWIYYRTIIRNIHFDDEMNLEDARNLKFYIEATALTGWTELPGALLWVLLVATAALRSHPEGFAVSGHLSTSTLCVGVRHWLPVRRILEKFMLIEALVDQNAYNAATAGSSCGPSSTSGSVSSTLSGLTRESASDTSIIDENGFDEDKIGFPSERM